uniref:Uncharacterized protein n=1 Tax=Arundo donax TaxID=35708 RepID=A0A0A8YRQ4_ARUDO
MPPILQHLRIPIAIFLLFFNCKWLSYLLNFY